jgi:alpha-methylacyl-CoA racemase
VFECADGKYVSIGSIEPQFYALLLEKTGLTNDPDFAKQMDTSQWPALKAKLQNVMKQKTQAQWCAIMEGTDVCFAPVLTMSEAAQHPHNVARNTFIDIAGIKQPAPAPRFSRTSASVPTAPAHAGQHSKQILSDWGVNNIDELLASGAVVDGSAQ